LAAIDALVACDSRIFAIEVCVATFTSPAVSPLSAEKLSSPLRGLYDKNRNFLTCEQAATRINTDSGDISGANTSPFLQQI
ncbi:hypothetical protein ACSLOT_28085, partial [Escherichia coli]|uniref:hypothetical protein n=1 Tax=Escherichia coli TaxID=562 RepID=UPI003EDFA198